MKMIFAGPGERDVPGHGRVKPGDMVEFSEEEAARLSPDKWRPADQAGEAREGTD